MTHTDAFTGNDIEGQAVILATTEGPLLVARAQVEVRADLEELAAAVEVNTTTVNDQVAALTARVEELEDQLRAVAEVPTPAEAGAPAELVEAAKVPAQRKAAAK